MSTGCQKDRNIERQRDQQTDRTKVVKNVNRMSEK